MARTVISDDNRVTVQAGDIDRGGFTANERAAGFNRAGGRRETRISDGGASVSDVRRGYESMNAPTRAGTGYMSRSEFEAVSGMTDTNPYGNDGILSRVFGIDPSKIDYTNNLGPRGIENVKRQAYDRFLNPFAQVDAFGRPTMGADASLGLTRSGVQPGDLTVFGPAVQSQREGIAGLFENTPLGSLMPKQTRIPGYDMNVLLPDLMDGPAVGGGTEPPGVPYFTSSTAPTRDAASVPESTFRPLFTTDPEERNLIEEDFEVDRRATEEDSLVPSTESTYDLESRLDRRRAAPPTVAEIILNEELTPSGNTVIQNIGTGDTGSATIQRNAPSLGTSLEDLERSGARSDFLMDIIEELRRTNPLDEPVLPEQSLAPSTGDPIDLIGMIPPRPMTLPTSKPSRGPTPGDLAFAKILEQQLAAQKALR